MKVALELQPCIKEKSGIGIYAYEIAKQLQFNKEIQLIGNVFQFGGIKKGQKKFRELEFKQAVCPYISYSVYKRIWNHIPMQYNKLFNHKPELTHFFNVIIPPHIEGKVINTIHDLTFYLYPETIGERHLKFLLSNIQRSAERPDKIITISESSKQGIIETLKIDPAKIEIVYPGVNLSFYQSTLGKIEIENIRMKYQLPNRYILYMGTLEPRKNIERIIEAFALFKINKQTLGSEFKLVLSGKKGWLYDSIFKKVKACGIEKEVIFTDYVEESEKLILYRLADLFMFPSLYEGFGIPVLEAMASGVPVITSNTSSLPEVAGDAAILVDPYNVEEMAVAIEKILGNEVFRHDLICKGYKQALKFNWSNSATQLYEIYKEVLQLG